MKNGSGRKSEELSITRRDFMTCAAVAGAAILTQGCSGSSHTVPENVSKLLNNASTGDAVAVASMVREAGGANPGVAALENSVRAVIEELGGLSWLRRGDRVLLKIASNSSHRYPSVTRPELATAVASILKNAGAGRVIVADHPGVATVHHTRDSRKGSSREVFTANGHLAAAAAADCDIVGFEESGYDSFFASLVSGAQNWAGPVMIPNLVREVDHIIYLNRVSTHVLGGSTLALKSAVGWLREDSRLELHRDADTFLEKCAEINAAGEIRQRLRFCLTDASEVQTTIGPDIGYSAAIDPPLLIGSKNIAMHDVACAGLLAYAREELTPWYAALPDPYPRFSNFLNMMFVKVTWGSAEGDNYRAMTAPARGRAVENPIIRRGIELFSPGAARPRLVWMGTVPEMIRDRMANA